MRRLSLLTLAALLFAGGIYSVARPIGQAAAYTGADFQPGYIIDDGVFFNSGAMDTNTIQSFLAAKVPSCDTNGTLPYAGTTAAAYGTSRGYPPPYTCLKDYRATTVAKPADSLCSGYAAVNQSAAQIIYGVAQSCGINPQVLIVTLQKEQGLVTDSWPWSSQYQKAMGYGCPDSGTCDTQYYGLFNQVYSAARQFKNYTRNPLNYNYVAGQNNTILYSPTAGCGSTSVFIKNNATAALYDYTPYQPNAAALANLYGSGDSCSSYGNRNFWRYFNDWFGTTYSPVYSWAPAGQGVYTDSSMTTPLGWDGTFLTGQSAFAVVRARNTGNFTWTNTGPNPINLGTSWPGDRSSTFCTVGWLGCGTRAATLTEATVAPGEIGTFKFPIKAPNNPGTYVEHFSLLADGKSWFNDPGQAFTFRVNPYVYSWAPVGQGVYTDSSMTTPLGWNATLLTDQTAYAVIRAKNTSNFTWTNTGANPVNLGTSWPGDRRSAFCTVGWLGCGARPASLVEATVAPGEIGTFKFPIKAPSTPGTYVEHFSLLADGKSWFNDPGQTFTFKVNPYVYSWAPVGQGVYTDSSMTTPLGWDATLTTNQTAYAVVKAKNTSNFTWTNIAPNPINLGTSWPGDRSSTFCTVGWLGCGARPATLTEVTVAPGQVGTFKFPIKAPAAPGTYIEHFSLLADGKSWFNDPGQTFTFRVN